MISRLRVQPWLSSLRSGKAPKVWKFTNFGQTADFKLAQLITIGSISLNRSFLNHNNNIYGRSYSVTVNEILPEELQGSIEGLVENEIEVPTDKENNGILNIKTFRRKKTKLKKSKRRQRRKKIRRLSERKRKKRNY